MGAFFSGGADGVLFWSAIAVLTMVGAGAILLAVGIVLGIAHSLWVRRNRRAKSSRARSAGAGDDDERRRVMGKICLVTGAVLLVAATTVLAIVILSGQ